MKFTFICHLAAFLFILSLTKSDQMTNNSEFHIYYLVNLLKNEICKQDMAERKLASPIKL